MDTVSDEEVYDVYIEGVWVGMLTGSELMLNIKSNDEEQNELDV